MKSFNKLFLRFENATSNSSLSQNNVIYFNYLSMKGFTSSTLKKGDPHIQECVTKSVTIYSLSNYFKAVPF